jgi:hypothetical protein
MPITANAKYSIVPLLLLDAPFTPAIGSIKTKVPGFNVSYSVIDRADNLFSNDPIDFLIFGKWPKSSM